MKYILIAFIFCSCSHIKNKTTSTTSDISNLKQKTERYLDLSKRHLSKGWLDNCDALLWASLYQVSGGSVDLYLAEDSKRPGRWYRTPGQDCFKTGRSASSISRDMLLGLAIALWETKDKAAVDRLLAYGNKNNWVMGDAKDLETKLGRTLMSPTLIGSYYQIRHKLGGPEKKVIQSVPLVAGNVKGYRRHLNLLHIYLRGRVNGSINQGQLKYLKRVVTEQPMNALAHAIYHNFSDGDQTDAIAILMNEEFFPADTLPDNYHRCTDYLWQRDFGDDWKPCKDKSFNIHEGIDFLFASHIVMRKLR